MHTLARTLWFVLLAGLAFPLLGHSHPETSFTPAHTPQPSRVVYLARNLSDEALLSLDAAVAARDQTSFVLLDSDKSSPYTRAFLTAYRPSQVVPVGSFPDGIAEMERRLNVRAAPPLAWNHPLTPAVWQTLFPQARNVVVCPAEPRGQLLQAACLAGVLHAPLFILHDPTRETASLHGQLKDWQTQQVFLVGKAGRWASSLPNVNTVRLNNEAAVALAHRRHLARSGRVATLVATNPADLDKERGGISTLAPGIALRKHAALLLTNAAGDNVTELVRDAQRQESLADAENLLLAANLKAIPMEQRPNPIPADKDPVIDMEPLTPMGQQPFTFAVGRLFHEDRGVVLLQLARQRLLAEARGPRRALVASNAGGSLNLLETFSRNTAWELRNAGYDTTALFGEQITGDKLRRQLTRQDIFLWEGHQSTLVREYAFPSWSEPLPPVFVFLQSCLALQEEKVDTLLRRGAIGVVGTSTRTYSASGGACSLAFFNALLYEQRSLGASLRQAKNFLLVYSQLKEKRLGLDARRTGANLRAAWAFTLWGDPTLELPRPETPEQAKPPIRHDVLGNTIVLTLPEETHQQVTTEKYHVAMLPNGRLAGLVRKQADEEERRPLVPFVFAEVHLPKARPGMTPTLHGRLPSRRWVFCWDERRRCGYLLAMPRAEDRHELRFHVEWRYAEAAARLADKVTR